MSVPRGSQMTEELRNRLEEVLDDMATAMSFISDQDATRFLRFAYTELSDILFGGEAA